MTALPYESSKPLLYKLSGKVSPQVLAVGLPACLFLSALIGFATGMLEFFCHTIRFTKLIILSEIGTVAATGALLGLLVAFLLENLGSRSRPFNLLSAIASSIVAIYFAWGGWLFCFALFAGHWRSPLVYLDPLRISFFVRTLYHRGSYTIFNDRVEGPVLLLFWLGEAATIIGFAIKIASSRTGNHVYCEHCKKWGTRRVLIEFRDENIAGLQSALLAGNLDALSSVQPRDLSEDRWCALLLEGCPSCDNTQTLTLQRTRFIRDSNGRTRTKHALILQRLFLTPEQTAKLAVIAAGIQASTSE